MKYGDEGMDVKKLLIFLLRKLWLVLAAAAAGALIGGGIYLFTHTVINNNRQYQAQSKLYLDFAADETGEVYQQYNGYTWNDLMSTDLIINGTMSYLPADYTKEEVTEATSAQILSDLRLLTITITTSDSERTAAILAATDASLVEMGKREKEFMDIEVIKETEPELVTASPRLMQAALVGLIVAAVLMLIAMAIIYILNDDIYVPMDLRCVTGLEFAGFDFTDEAAAGETAASGKETRVYRLARKFKEDLETNLAYLSGKYGELKRLELGKNKAVSGESFDEMRKAGGILLVVPYGRLDRSELAYALEQLALQDCKPVGIIIKDADMRFMKWYYTSL